MITWRASRKPWSLSIRTRGKGVVVDYRECHTTAEVLLYVGRAEPSTVIFDVEPLIAHWDTGDTALTEGMSFFVNQLERTSAVDMIVFATNSKRRPSAMPSGTRSRGPVYRISDEAFPNKIILGFANTGHHCWGPDRY